MRESAKTKQQLSAELRELHERVSQLEQEKAEMSLALQMELRKREELSSGEARYQALFNTMLRGVVCQNSDGRIIAVNPAARKILGLSLEQMQGGTSVAPQWRAIHEDGTDFPDETHPAMVALKTGEPERNVVMGVYHPERDEYRWININAIPSFHPGRSTPYLVYSVFEDITERKQAETALRASEKKYRELFGSMTEGFGMHEIILDEDGKPCDWRFLELNAAWEHQTGIPRKDVLGKTMRQVWPDLDAYWLETYSQVALTGNPVHYENFHSPLQRWYGTFAYSPKPNHFALLFFDITARKQVEEALQKTVQRFNNILSNVLCGVLLVSQEGRVEFANQCFCDQFGLEASPQALIGLTAEQLLERTLPAFADPEKNLARIRQILAQGNRVTGEEISMEGGQVFLRDFIPITVGDEPKGRMWAHRDITERKQMEQELRKSRDELENRVMERTREIDKKNRFLQESNAALNALLRQIADDKRVFEASVMTNFNKLVLPYLKKLKNSNLSANQVFWVEILESHFHQITSSFVQRLSNQFTNLTPTEMQVAVFIREGHSTKEIAELLNSAEKTIACHRENIRKKFGLRSRNANLRSFLLSMS